MSRLTDARRRSIDTLRRTRAILDDVIATNRTLREFPGHEESADRRIREAEAEIDTVEAQIESLEKERPER